MSDYILNLLNRPRQPIFLFRDIVQEIANPAGPLALAMLVGGRGLGKSHTLRYLYAELTEQGIPPRQFVVLAGTHADQTARRLRNCQQDKDSWRILFVDDFDRFVFQLREDGGLKIRELGDLLFEICDVAADSVDGQEPRKVVITSSFSQDEVRQPGSDDINPHVGNETVSLSVFSRLVERFPEYILDPWERDWYDNIRLNVDETVGGDSGDDKAALVSVWVEVVARLTMGHPTLVAGCLNELHRLRQLVSPEKGAEADRDREPSPFIREFVVPARQGSGDLAMNLREHLKAHLIRTCARDIRREIKALQCVQDDDHKQAYADLCALARAQSRILSHRIEDIESNRQSLPRLSTRRRLILNRFGLVCRLRESGADAVPGELILEEILGSHGGSTREEAITFDEQPGGTSGALILRHNGVIERIELTGTTYLVAKTLAEAVDRSVPLATIQSQLGKNTEGAIRSALQRLHARIRDRIGSADVLQNTYGEGYRFDSSKLR